MKKNRKIFSYFILNALLLPLFCIRCFTSFSRSRFYQFSFPTLRCFVTTFTLNKFYFITVALARNNFVLWLSIVHIQHSPHLFFGGF